MVKWQPHIGRLGATMSHDRPVDREAEDQVGRQFQKRIVEQPGFSKLQNDQQQQRLMWCDPFRAIDSQFSEFLNDSVVRVCHDRVASPSLELVLRCILGGCERVFSRTIAIFSPPNFLTGIPQESLIRK